MIKYTTESGKTKVVEINAEACMQARMEGMSWAHIGTGETLEGGVLERTTRFGRNCNQASLGDLRKSDEWADAVRAFAVTNELNVEETLAKWCRGPRVSRGSAPSENGAPTAVPTPTAVVSEPTPTFEVSAAETILRSEQRIAMSDLTAAHKTAMVELEAAHVRAVEELRIAQVSAEQAMLTEHAGALEALKAEEAAAAEAAKAEAEAAAEAAKAAEEANDEGGDEPPSPPSEPTTPSEDVEEDAEVSDVEPTEDADVSAEVDTEAEAHAEELRKRKEHLVRKGEMLKAQFEEAASEATQTALHGLMQKNRGEILAIASELGEPSDTEKAEELAA